MSRAAATGRHTRRTRRARSLALAVALAVALAGAVAGPAGCGSDEAATKVPTAAELAGSLLVAGELPGDWSVNAGPEDGTLDASGVLTDEQQGLLPRIDLCDRADAASKAAAESLRWRAYRQLDLAPADPIDPPADREGHLAFVQEFLTAAEPAATKATFDALRAGAMACMGEIPAGEEGPGMATELAVPALGEDRFGMLTTIEEAGGGGVWEISNVMVRNGPVLAMLSVVDIRMGDVEPLFGADEVGAFARTAVGKL